MGLLAEELRAIIEGPLGTEDVTESTITERVRALRQHERRHVFGAVVYRDGDDSYYLNDASEPVTRRQVIESIKADLEAHGRLLGEKMSLGAMLATKDQQKAVDDAEERIGQMFKKLAKQYTQALKRMTGANWRVVSASESILSLDSDESPKRAVDIYWEYDPGTMTATIYVEGPRGKQKSYQRQKLSDIPKKNYVDWLSQVLSEDMEKILALALYEEEPVETEPEVESEAVQEENGSRAALLEEVWGVLDEAAAVAYRRSMAKQRPMHVGSSADKKGAVDSAAKVKNLFKQLVKALTSGGDWDSLIKALRREGVSEKHINFAIRRKQVPFAFSEDVDESVLP